MVATALASPADPFASLNEEQRAAVEHGQAGEPAGPLLVIAGAGTGKTMTLAARVARLVLDGADPRAAAADLLAPRRERDGAARRPPAAPGTGPALHAAPPALPWSGTFHAIGARLLREHADRAGLSPQFTIHDRGDAEDLMGWVRQELGCRHGKPLPAQAHLPGHLLARSTAACRWTRCWPTHVPLVPGLGGRAEAPVPRLRRHQAAQQVLDYDDLLLYWQQMMEEPAHRRGDRVALRPRAGRRVPGHQPPAGRHPARPQARRPRRHGGRRRRAGDLRRSAPPTVRNILDFPAQFDAAGARAALSATTARRSRSSTPRTP
jgi:DNA helicase-2/ATP-dependent DNA helicase PcrA